MISQIGITGVDVLLVWCRVNALGTPAIPIIFIAALLEKVLKDFKSVGPHFVKCFGEEVDMSETGKLSFIA